MKKTTLNALEKLERKGEQRRERLTTDDVFKQHVSRYEKVPAEVRKLFAALTAEPLSAHACNAVHAAMGNGYMTARGALAAVLKEADEKPPGPRKYRVKRALKRQCLKWKDRVELI